MRSVAGLLAMLASHAVNCLSDTAITRIYTLSLHDALPISTEDRGAVLRVPQREARDRARGHAVAGPLVVDRPWLIQDRKSTRLNSSHLGISYAVFCLKKKTSTLSAAPPRGATSAPTARQSV